MFRVIPFRKQEEFEHSLRESADWGPKKFINTIWGRIPPLPPPGKTPKNFGENQPLSLRGASLRGAAYTSAGAAYLYHRSNLYTGHDNTIIYRYRQESLTKNIIRHSMCIV